jgi:hypothetical protein
VSEENLVKMLAVARAGVGEEFRAIRASLGEELLAEAGVGGTS